MSGKKGGRKAAASAAAHAASKRKTSAIEISADNESRVRDALKVRITKSVTSLVNSAREAFPQAPCDAVPLTLDGHHINVPHQC